jgi:hypothetical protein
VAEQRYRGEKAQFNMQFDPLLNYRPVTHAGNLALRTNNLAFIMQEILGATHVHIARKAGGPPAVPLAPAVAGVTTSTFTTVAQLALAFQNHFTGIPHAFALGAIYADIVEDDHISNASAGNASNPNLAYNHWIVITSFDRRAVGSVPGCPNAHADVGIWTWAESWDAEICEQHVLSYIQDVIFGRF